MGLSSHRIESYREWIARAAAGYDELLRTASLDAAVPSCPGWTLLELTAHLGEVHRWATGHVLGLETADEEQWRAPASGTEAMRAWFAEGADALLVALASRACDEPCWTLYPPAIVGTWARRQALETALHFWDAQLAAGIEGTIDTELAVDGVHEVLSDMFPRQLALGRQESLQVTVEVRLTDAAPASGEPLLLGAAQSGDSVQPVAVIEADARDMFLLLWGRRGLERSGVTWSGSEDAVRTVLGAALVP